MDDIDEGIGSNDSIDGNPAFIKTIDHLKALNQLKRLNGESVTSRKLCHLENEQSDDFEPNAVLQNGKLSAETLAKSPKDACKKVNVLSENGEHEKSSPSTNTNLPIDGKEENSDTKSCCNESLQKNDIEDSKSTNGCYLNGTDKFVENEIKKNDKLRVLIANAKNSLKIPKPDKMIDLDLEETKSDTEEVSKLHTGKVPEFDAGIVSEATKPVTETVLADPPVVEKIGAQTGVSNDTDTIQIDEGESKQKTHDKKENGVNQSDDDDDDDDVIFEGESKVPNDTKSPSHPDCTILPTTDESLTDSPKEAETKSKEDAHRTVILESKAESEGLTKDLVEEKNNSLKKQEGKLTTNTDINLDEDDDDVIFEGETKVDTQSKHIEPSVTSPSDITTSVNENEQPESKTDNLRIEQQETSSNCQAGTNSEDDDVIFERETKINISVKDIFHTDKGLKEDKVMGLKEDMVLKEEENEKTVDKPQSEDQTSANCDIKDSKGDNNSKLSLGPESKTANGERKRPAESILIDSDSKRSKLEPVAPLINVNDSTSWIDLIDTDEENMDTSEHVTNGVPNHKENNKNGHAELETTKMITLSEQELDTLIRSKLKAFLAAQRDTLLAQMSQKLQCFQTNNDIWKRQVKELQVKVNEATVLQQKHEKRKAHTAALRQITTRNVAVQVDDGRTSNAKTRQPPGVAAGSPNKPGPKSVQNVMSPVVTAPPGANGMIRLPIPQSSIASSILPNTGQKVSPDFKMPTVKSLLDTTRTQPTISSVTQNNGTSTHQIFNVQYPQRTVTHASTASTNFISLTTTQVVPASTGAKLVSQPGGSKIIDLTDDEPRVLAGLPQAITAVNTTAGMRTLVREGSQFVRATFPNTPGSFQLVFPPGTQPIRPGTMITGLPATMIPSSFVTNTPQINPPPVATTTAIVNRPPPRLQNPALVQTVTVKPPQPIPTVIYSAKHPAPYPPLPSSQSSAAKSIPPKPSLRVSRVNQGIVLSWNMTLTDTVAEVQSYQLFAYQETSAAPQSSLWKKVGDVKALPLPMACTLTQFQVGNKYHFAVRALDVHGRVSEFSEPSSLHMEKAGVQ